MLVVRAQRIQSLWFSKPNVIVILFFFSPRGLTTVSTSVSLPCLCLRVRPSRRWPMVPLATHHDSTLHTLFNVASLHLVVESVLLVFRSFSLLFTLMCYAVLSMEQDELGSPYSAIFLAIFFSRFK